MQRALQSVVRRQPKKDFGGRHAIFVLGPSAAGKTFTTKRLLERVLRSNGWPRDLGFFSVDGGACPADKC